MAAALPSPLEETAGTGLKLLRVRGSDTASEGRALSPCHSCNVLMIFIAAVGTDCHSVHMIILQSFTAVTGLSLGFCCWVCCVCCYCSRLQGSIASNSTHSLRRHCIDRLQRQCPGVTSRRASAARQLEEQCWRCVQQHNVRSRCCDIYCWRLTLLLH